MQNHITAGAMFPTLASLQREVQAMSRRVHRQSVLRARNEVGDYAGLVVDLLNDILNQGDAHEKVICFASAAEFGIPMDHQSERCRLAAIQTGSNAMRVLYWTAIRRMRSAWPTSDLERGQRAVTGQTHVAQVATETRRSRAPETVLCRQCVALRTDALNSRGHDALHPMSETYFRWIGGGVLAEAIEHACRTCSTTWTQHKSAANLFVSWSISNGGISLGSRH